MVAGSIKLRIDQQPPDPARQVAFEAAKRFPPGLPLGLFASQELARWRVTVPLAHRDAVKGAVELAVATAVEPVADPFTR